MKYLTIIFLLTVNLVYANGSETGHGTGNGHDDHETTGTTQTVNTQTTTQSNSVVTDVVANSSQEVSVDSSSASRAVVSVQSGDNQSQASVTGTTASVGEVSTISQGGSTGDISIDTGNDSAASAATLVTAVCQTGASAQTRDGGFSLAKEDIVCEYSKAALTMWNAYQRELDLSKCREVSCTVECDNTDVFLAGSQKVCNDAHLETAEEFYANYLWYVRQIPETHKQQSGLDKLDRGSRSLVVPTALISALMWLL